MSLNMSRIHENLQKPSECTDTHMHASTFPSPSHPHPGKYLVRNPAAGPGLDDQRLPTSNFPPKSCMLIPSLPEPVIGHKTCLIVC